jgi:hypothetical protein
MTAKIDPGDTNQGRVTFLRRSWVISTPPLTEAAWRSEQQSIAIP